MQMVNKDSNAYTVSRRDFLASAACGMAGLALPCGGRGATDLPLAGTVPSLNYWCTWAMQGMTRRLPEWHRKVAPAVLSRGVALPKVKPLEAEPPFAAAMLHPNGALAVGVFPRVKGGRWWTPKAEVLVDVAPRPGSPIGVFGEMSALKVKGDLKAGGARVFARDLVGGVWHDITAALAYVDGETILPGDILAKIGREAAPADIYSSPGTLIFNKQRS